MDCADKKKISPKFKKHDLSPIVHKWKTLAVTSNASVTVDSCY